VIATNVYLKEQGAWYLAEHHGSLPLIEGIGPAANGRSLH
jgi:hypothetical protein